MTPRVSFRLRNPANPEEVYGEGFEDENEAASRAQQLADFYGHPIEICHVTFGRFVRAGSLVEPGPTAPPPLIDRPSTTRPPDA
jgi:hypothetical protein